jgi:hypothetical protein
LRTVRWQNHDDARINFGYRSLLLRLPPAPASCLLVRLARLVVMHSFFKMFENVYLHCLDKSVDANVWMRNSPMLPAYARQPGARYYLSHRQKIFDPRFWAFLDENSTSDVPAGHEVSGLGTNEKKTTQGVAK